MSSEVDVLRPSAKAVADERNRIQAEHVRRAREVDAERYAPWQPSTILGRNGRVRAAAQLLKAIGAFPAPGDQCLEIGYGSGGWLPDLIAWGVGERDLHGIELYEERAVRARRLLPVADLRVGDATELPWPDGTFRLVVISTVFSSILDHRVRQLLAAEAARVTAHGATVLWYDLRVNNPQNPNVRGIGRRDIESLFSDFRAVCHSVTLAPPVARRVAPRSWVAAHALEALPFLRTHLIAALTKP